MPEASIWWKLPWLADRGEATGSTPERVAGYPLAGFGMDAHRLLPAARLDATTSDSAATGRPSELRVMVVALGVRLA